MFSKFLPKIYLVAFLAIAASFYFGFTPPASAQLPVEAGLGEDCDTGTPCDSRFYCSAGVCVECESEAQCDEQVGEKCVENVCTLSGGNNVDGLCASDANCRSGTKCSAAGICEAVGGFKKALNLSCQTTQDCAGGLFCSSAGRCVECETLGDCTEPPADEEFSVCEGGVCVLEGGNPEGAWCAKDSHCTSEKCSAGNLCLVGAGPAGEEGGEWDWTGVDITIEDVANIIEGLACWLTRIATAVMVIFLVLAGLRFMNARGNPTAYQAAVKNFQHVLIGILVIMAVYVIIATVAATVGRTDFSLIPLVC